MDVAGEAEMAGTIELSWPHAILRGDHEAVGRGLGEAWVFLGFLPGDRVLLESCAVVRRECCGAGRRHEILLDRRADFVAG